MSKKYPTIETTIFVNKALSKRNDIVEFRWGENIEDENRGFVAHEMSAWIEGERRGYLRVTYVPRENIATYLPTVFHYLGSLGGKYYPELFVDFGKKAIQISELSGEDKLSFAQRINEQFRLNDAVWDTEDDLLKLLKKIRT
jgi:hypothetical protein